MAKELSQPEQRRYRTYRDQHGREWGTAIDVRTGHSVGPWEPRFSAPWYPDAKYLRHDLTDDRLVRIDYDRNIADLKQAHDDYDDLRLKVAMNEYGSAFTSKLGATHDEDPPELKKLVGKAPFPLAYPEAAKDGNKWVLGFSTLIPTWAYALLHAETAPSRKYFDAEDEAVEQAVDLDEHFDPDAIGGKREPVKKGRGHSEYTEFVRDHKGKSLSEISQLWKAHKAAVAA